jgi:hypothetical protein
MNASALACSTTLTLLFATEAAAQPPTAVAEAAAPAPAPAPAPEAAPPAAPPEPTTAAEPASASASVTGVKQPPPKPAPAKPPEPQSKPESPYKHVPFDIGLVPGLSINGRHEGKRVRNNFSIAFGWTRAARVDGIAAGLGATVVDEQMQGIAASLGANIVRGTMRGVQYTHGYNFAADLRGVQNGAINRAHTVRGLQIGLINIGGHVRGAQIGLINWAKSADASFALLPVTKEGGIRFEASTSDTALLNVGIRLPARYTYVFAGVGIHPFGTERGHTGTNLERGKAWEFGGGFGGHIPVTDEVFIDLDVSGWGVTSGLRAGAALGGMSKARLMVGWQAAPRIAIFGGPTLNVLVDRGEEEVGPLRGSSDARVQPRLGRVERPGYGWVAYEREMDGVRMRVWPGFVAGVRF